MEGYGSKSGARFFHGKIMQGDICSDKDKVLQVLTHSHMMSFLHVAVEIVCENLVETMNDSAVP